MSVPDPATAPPELPGEMRLALLWMFVAAGLVFIPFIFLAIRRATISGRTSPKKRKPVVHTSAWEEAGRRLNVGGGASRLDDTVDIDPFDSQPDDGPW